ncbi:MAG: DUF4347 domain-containing protein [Deltaproteobacteria bacterium]
MPPLRLMVFDRTCLGQDRRAPLSLAWQGGGLLYGALGRLDARRGVSTWAEALDWLAFTHPGRPIAEIQFWGHGEWGCAFVGAERLGVEALDAAHPLEARLRRVRERMVPGGEALWWFRTCETFGGHHGHAFATAWSRYFGARVAGHTYVIGAWQSGLHVVRPGETPSWPLDEGFDPRSAKDRPSALVSSRKAPNTVHCLQGALPGKPPR